MAVLAGGGSGSLWAWDADDDNVADRLLELGDQAGRLDTLVPDTGVLLTERVGHELSEIDVGVNMVGDGVTAGTNTLTSATAPFEAAMVGLVITIAGHGRRVVESYASATSIDFSGPAIAADTGLRVTLPVGISQFLDGVADGTNTITSVAAPFNATHVGTNMSIAGIGTREIVTFTSASSVDVDGAAIAARQGLRFTLVTDIEPGDVGLETAGAQVVDSHGHPRLSTGTVMRWRVGERREAGEPRDVGNYTGAEDLGGFAFAADFEDTYILDPDDQAISMPTVGDTATVSVMWGVYSDKTTLSWWGRLKVTNRATTTAAGAFSPQVYQCENGDLIIAVMGTSGFDIMASDDTTVLASVARRGDDTYTVYVWRLAAGGDSMVWGVKEIYGTYIDGTTGLGNPGMWLRSMLVSDDESNLIVEPVFQNFVNTAAGTYLGVGDAGWTRGGSPDTDLEVQIPNPLGHNWFSMPITTVFDAATGAPSKITHDGDPGSQGSFQTSFYPAGLRQAGDTHYGQAYAYLSGGGTYEMDVPGAGVPIPGGGGNSQNSHGVARRAISGAGDWFVAPDPPVKNGLNIPWAAYEQTSCADNAGSVYFTDVLPNNVADNITQSRFPTAYTTGADAAWGRRHENTLLKLNATGQLVWQARITQVNNAFSFKQLGIWLSPDQSVIYMMTLAETNLSTETFVFDPGGANETTFSQPSIEDGLYLSAWNASTGELDYVVWVNKRVGTEDYAKPHRYGRNLTVRPVSGEIVVGTKADFTAAPTGYVMRLGNLNLTATGSWQQWQLVVVHADAADGAVNAYTRVFDANSNRRFRVHGR